MCEALMGRVVRNEAEGDKVVGNGSRESGESERDLEIRLDEEERRVGCRTHRAGEI